MIPQFQVHRRQPCADHSGYSRHTKVSRPETKIDLIQPWPAPTKQLHDTGYQHCHTLRFLAASWRVSSQEASSDIYNGARWASGPCSTHAGAFPSWQNSRIWFWVHVGTHPWIEESLLLLIYRRGMIGMCTLWQTSGTSVHFHQKIRCYNQDFSNKLFHP